MAIIQGRQAISNLHAVISDSLGVISDFFTFISDSPGIISDFFTFISDSPGVISDSSLLSAILLSLSAISLLLSSFQKYQKEIF
ncbi:hypothetical protein ACQKNB_09695 [Lysinibacillus xylanilyticus]|uniref:hypothetical protein n=1 Tax=Lysinibacillus xylanilyticus TaxID=582475 RepID=UPI003D0607AE